MKTKDTVCYPQDKCPLCGKFAVGYGSRRLKNHTKLFPITSANIDKNGVIIYCKHCNKQLIMVNDLLNNAEAPAARVSG